MVLVVRLRRRYLRQHLSMALLVLGHMLSDMADCSVDRFAEYAAAGIKVTRSKAGDNSPVYFFGEPCEILKRSSKYNEECGHRTLEGSSDRPATCLVTGLGRTGTKYTATILNHIGWNISHDSKQVGTRCVVTRRCQLFNLAIL